MDYQNSKVVVLVFLILIIFLLYNKKCENFSNLMNTSNKNYGYNNLTDNSAPYYGYKEEELTELQIILNQIINQINTKSKSNFYLGNLENITITQQPNNKLNYIIDVFLFEKDKYYTLRTMINFTSDSNNQVEVNNITRGNAFKYNLNNSEIERHPQVFERTMSSHKNFNNVYTIKGINDSSLNFSITDGLNIGDKNIPTPIEHDKDILPLSIQEDGHYKAEQNRQLILKNTHLKNRPNCWDCNGINKENPHHLSCNIFEREQEHLIDSIQPKFNSSIHKNLSDKKENEWLFSPTRLEIDHNL